MYRTEVTRHKTIDNTATPLQPSLHASTAHGLDGKSGEEIIETRFGHVTISYDAPIHLEKGMLGMPEKQYFCLTAFPVKQFPQFKLMQCLQDHQLSFIVMPLHLQNDLIAQSDLLETITDLGYDAAQVALYLVVNVYREASHVRVSVNARAPIFVNMATYKAEQAVLRNTRYMVRHMLSSDAGKPASSA
ncbi:MAG: flagellar assembly protein FliW [Sphaerospermopsis sp. SIO1G2]|nr:flagellar assembly protein FliW [Sphaerospermopsis sp. SIO1G2]